MNDNFNTRMILTTAVVAAVAALLAGPAAASVRRRWRQRPRHVGDGAAGPVGREGPHPVLQPRDRRRSIAVLGHGRRARSRDPNGARGRGVRAASGSVVGDPGLIPYLSHEIFVDQSLWGGQVSLGLTGDSPITRVVGQEPAGLTGDSARTRGQVFQANTTLASNGDSDVNWTWVGFGAGMAALLAAAMGALYLSARHRDRVALP